MHLTFGSVQTQEGCQARAEGEGKVTTRRPLVVRLTHYNSWLEPVPWEGNLNISGFQHPRCGGKSSVERVFHGSSSWAEWQ